jgi:hypothetical protein
VGGLKETASSVATCQNLAVKPKKSKQARDEVPLAAVTTEMELPRLVDSARAQAEAAGHRATNCKRKLNGRTLAYNKVVARFS